MTDAVPYAVQVLVERAGLLLVNRAVDLISQGPVIGKGLDLSALDLSIRGPRRGRLLAYLATKDLCVGGMFNLLDHTITMTQSLRAWGHLGISILQSPDREAASDWTQLLIQKMGWDEVHFARNSMPEGFPALLEIRAYIDDLVLSHKLPLDPV